jgi:tetratricopeptide (TPR) repeat protein
MRNSIIPRRICGAFFVRFAATLAACLALQSTASADDWADCNTPPNLDRVLAGCTAVIDQGTRSPQDMVRAYVIRAAVYGRRGLYDWSLADAESALKIDPNSVLALVNRAVALRQKGRTDDALADVNRALAIDPRNITALTFRGTARSSQKEWDQALADFDQVIAQRADNPNAFVARRNIYVQMGSLDKAIVDFNRAIALNPNLWSGFFYRGDAYRRKGDLDSAMSDINRALALDPRNVVILNIRGQVFSARGDYARALADFDAALAIAPDNKFAQEQRRIALATQAEMERTRNSGTAQNPAVAKLLEQATPLINQHKFDEAIVLLDQALTLDPNALAALQLRVWARVWHGRLRPWMISASS